MTTWVKIFAACMKNRISSPNAGRIFTEKLEQVESLNKKLSN
jgi:predicted protein tyrosine phosphatase